MKLTIVVLLVCVTLSQAFNPWGIFKKWKDEAEEAVDSSDHQEQAQRLLDEVHNSRLHFENEEHHRNKVGKVWMKFKNKAEKSLENAKEAIGEVEEELNSRENIPERAIKVMKEVRQQTRDVVKSLKRIIRPIKLSKVSKPIEIPEFIEPKFTEEPEPEVLPTEFHELPQEPEPEVLPTEFHELPQEPEPEVLPTEFHELPQEPEPEVLPTEEPEFTEEPEVLPTEFHELPQEPEPEVLPTEVHELPQEPEPEVLPTEFHELPQEPEPEVLPTDVPEFTEEPEVLPTERPAPAENPEPEVQPTASPVESTNEPEVEVDNGEPKALEGEHEKEIDDEEDLLDEDDDDDEEPLQAVEEEEDDDDDDDEDDDEGGEDSTEVSLLLPEKETRKQEAIHEVIDVAPQLEIEGKQIMPKWLSKRHKKLRKLWEKYTLNNSEKVLQKIRKLESSLVKKKVEGI